MDGDSSRCHTTSCSLERLLFIDGVLVQSDSSPLDPPTTAVRDTVLGVTASGKTENVVQFDDFLLSGTN